MEYFVRQGYLQDPGGTQDVKACGCVLCGACFDTREGAGVIRFGCRPTSLTPMTTTPRMSDFTSTSQGFETNVSSSFRLG